MKITVVHNSFGNNVTEEFDADKVDGFCAKCGGTSIYKTKPKNYQNLIFTCCTECNSQYKIDFSTTAKIVTLE